MRVVVAPDKFAGTLSAVAAAEAIAKGWLQSAPGDSIQRVPMSDGGAGFIGVLHARLGGDLTTYTVPGPGGAPVQAQLLRVGECAYLESAQPIGIAAARASGVAAERASSYGLGELLAGALQMTGVTRIVVGIGGTGTNDAGAGLLAALGAEATGGAMDQGAAGLADLASVDLAGPIERCRHHEIVVATDVDSVLSGLFGATKNFGPQKGISEDRLPLVDSWLERYGALVDRKLASAKGAGAGGGVGFALMLLGGKRAPGIDLVAELVGFPQALAGADLVVTGEGSFDFSSRAGKVPYGVARLAERALVPCVVVAGSVQVGAREMRAMGIESAYPMDELVGAEQALGDAAGSLSKLASRVARTWSR